MTPFFSILVPVCNQFGKMDLCVDALTGQSFPDFEVILVDDGSKDASLAMLEGYAKADDRFHVYRHEENSSLLAARYTGMEHAQGAYILFVDSDDYIEKNTLEELHRLLADNPVDIVRFGYWTEPAGEAVLPILSEDPLRDCMYNRFTPSVWKNCYSRAVMQRVLERSGPFYCNMGEDVCLSGMLLACAESFAAIDQCFYHYITGEGMSNSGKNLTAEKLQRDLRSVEASGDHLIAFVEQFRPEYRKEAKVKAERMKKTVLAQHVLLEPDWNKAISFLSVFNNDRDEDLFCWACSEIIPQKVYFRVTGKKWDKPINWD